MEDEIRGARRELPGHRPEHLVAGVIRDRATAQLTVDELSGHGVCDESIFVIHGASGAEALRHRDEGAGLLRWVWGRFAEFAGAADDFVRRHAEAAEQGSYVIGVELRGAESRTKERVQRIFQSHGAHDIIHVGRGFTEEIMAVRPRLMAGQP